MKHRVEKVLKGRDTASDCQVSSDLRLKIQQVLPSVFTKYMHLFDTFHLMKRAATTFSSKTFSAKSWGAVIGCRQPWCVIPARAEILSVHSGVWVCVLIKSGAATELEQDEAPDVLTVGVAAGDAGTRYDSSFSRFYQRNKKKKETTLVLKREQNQATPWSRNTATWCVYVCTCVCARSCVLCKRHFWNIHREPEFAEVFFSTVMER